jgi:hypothetical protein
MKEEKIAKQILEELRNNEIVHVPSRPFVEIWNIQDTNQFSKNLLRFSAVYNLGYVSILDNANRIAIVRFWKKKDHISLLDKGINDEEDTSNRRSSNQDS